MRSVARAQTERVAQDEPVAAPGTARAPTPLALGVASVLALQRTAGNRKVAAMPQTGQAAPVRERLPALSSSELVTFMLSQRGFSGSKPGMPTLDPKGIGKPSGQGYATFAAVQVVDAAGNQVKIGLGAYTGGKGAPHAEHMATDELRAALKGRNVAGGRMMVAVDQVPCAGCAARLRAFAQEFQLGGYDVYVPERASLVDPMTAAGPKTSARSAFQGKRPPVKPSLVASEELVKPGPRPPTRGRVESAGQPVDARTRALAKSINASLKTDLRLLRVATVLKGALKVLEGVSALLTMKTFLDLTQSKLTSSGFMFSKEIDAADEVADDAAALKREYPAFSDSIQSKGWALLTAPVDRPSLGAVVQELASVNDDLHGFHNELGSRLTKLRTALTEVTAKRTLADEILEDPQASAAIAMATFGQGELAQIFAAGQDLQQLEGRLRTAVTALTTVHTAVAADIDFLSAWGNHLFPIWLASEMQRAAPATAP